MGESTPSRAAAAPLPYPGARRYRVWRDGFQGKAPARRQRFRCVNPLDRRDAHRFALPVLRAEAHDHRCLHCQQDVPSHAGPVVAGGYHYLSKVVSGALADVAKGQTYSEASLAARAALAQAGGRLTERVKFGLHGQLAADWTEVFAGVVTQGPAVWPGVVLLDSTKFWRRQNFRQVPAFTLLFAYGYDVVKGPHPEPDPWAVRPPERAVNGRLLRIGLATKQTETAWLEFLDAITTGTPLVVVADGDAAIEKAVRRRWGPAPTFVRCVYHWRTNLTDDLATDLARETGNKATSATVQNDPLMTQAKTAFASVHAWKEFSDATRARFRTTWSLAVQWIALNTDVVVAQLAEADERPGPQTTGPLEQVITRTRQRLAPRAQGLRNPVRTQRMLDLLTAGLTNNVNTEVWAERIYDHLAENDRHPARKQRQVAGLTM